MLVLAYAADQPVAVRGLPVDEVDDLQAAKDTMIGNVAQPLAGDSSGAERAYSALLLKAARAGGLGLVELQALTRLVELERVLGIEPDGTQELAAVYLRLDHGLDKLDLILSTQRGVRPGDQ